MSARPNSTKRELRIGGLALLAVAALGSTAVTEEKFHKLTGGQIRAKLAGMELTDNVHWRDLYQRNGTVMSTSMGRKRTGKWRVEQNQLCIEFEKEPVPNRAPSSRRAGGTNSGCGVRCMPLLMMVRGWVIGAMVLAASAADATAQDIAAGEAAFRKCQICHDVGETAKNKLGPELNGLDGRKAGTAEGYSYGDSNKN